MIIKILKYSCGFCQTEQDHREPKACLWGEPRRKGKQIKDNITCIKCGNYIAHESIIKRGK